MTEPLPQPSKHSKKIIIILIIFLLLASVIGLKFFGLSIPNLSQFTAAIKTEQPAATSAKEAATESINPSKNSNWKIITIEQLVRMADLSLTTTKDTKTALSYLLTAKKYTKDSDTTMQHALNKDIANLQAVPIINQEEILLKIETLNQQINSLSARPAATTEPTPTTAQPQQTTNKIKNALENILQGLKDIVIIRHQTTEPLLPPEQITILRLMIQTKLLQTELAVMQKQNELYQQCLEQTITLISNYSVPNDPTTTNILKTLKELQQVDLQPTLPSLTESLTTIQDIVESNPATQ